jgi:periplasmic protein CpxP/Spy
VVGAYGEATTNGSFGGAFAGFGAPNVSRKVTSQMSVLIERLVQIAKSGGLAAALLAVPMAGFAGPSTEIHTLAGAQVAQATSRPAPQRQAQPPQPAPPAAGNQEVERQITDLRRKLSITSAQQAQFDALAQAMRQNAEAISTLAQQEQPNGKPNAVEAVRAAGRFAEAEAEGLKRLLPPLQALYESLADQQKRTADQVFASSPEPEQPQGKRR